MNISYEIVKKDLDSSFRVLHVNQPISELSWEYHYHPEIELVCVKSGNGTRHVGYHKSNYLNGDLVLIGSNVPHSGFGLNSTNPHEEYVVQFNANIIPSANELIEFKDIQQMMELSKYGILFGKKTRKDIIPYLINLYESYGDLRYLKLLEILSILSQSKDFKLLNKEIMPYTIISKNKNRLQTIFTYVENNYHNEIDIQHVAELANLTLPAFCNFFKKATQITFTEFVNRYRIEKACFLLIQEKTVVECSYLCSFNNVTYFNRVFKKFIHKTPSEFIQQNKFN